MIRRHPAVLGVLGLALFAAACRPVTSGAPAATGSATVEPAPVSAAAVVSIGPGRLAGKAFDTCVAPQTSQMNAWLASPYRGVGIYIGGRNAACPPSAVPHLNASWVQTVTGQGWGLLPLWVGLQAPCYAGSGAKISTDLFFAAIQGILEADDAADAAATFGIGPSPAFALGNPIYFDLEGYPRNGTCSAAVRMFVSWWVARLHERGYRAGFYSSGASGIADEVDVIIGGLPYNVPDELWFAHWNGVQSAYDSPYVPNVLWYCHRHHQYLGGHFETYGGVPINIDSSASDGGVAHKVVGGTRTQEWPLLSGKCRV